MEFQVSPATPLQRKLKALNYHSPNVSPTSDHTHLRTLVIWLENQKIRHYKIEERGSLRDEPDKTQWWVIFKKYLTDMGCPHDPDSLTLSLHWLIDEAIKCEFDDVSKTHPAIARGLKNPDEARGSENRSSALDISSSDPIFSRGVTAIAKVLQVTSHPDPTVLLAACRLVIEEKLSANSLKKANEQIDINKTIENNKKSFEISAKQCGFELGDPVLNEAAKVLRLLHIEELRDLQTKVNELIVAVQSITADPKTDSKLGKVGV